MSTEPRNAPRWLKAFIALHCVAITVACLPPLPAEAREGKRPVQGTEYILKVNDKLKGPVQLYTWWSGTWQQWDMFAPNPSNWDGYVSARITYRDGSVKDYTYPRMYDLALSQRYLKERYRKFLERAHADAYDWLRPQFALRTALLNYDNPDNPPVKVELYRHWLLVPPTVTAPQYFSNLSQGVTAETLLPANPPLPPYNSSLYFPYIVPQDELRRLSALR